MDARFIYPIEHEGCATPTSNSESTNKKQECSVIETVDNDCFDKHPVESTGSEWCMKHNKEQGFITLVINSIFVTLEFFIDI